MMTIEKKKQIIIKALKALMKTKPPAVYPTLVEGTYSALDIEQYIRSHYENCFVCSAVISSFLSYAKRTKTIPNLIRERNKVISESNNRFTVYSYALENKESLC